MLLSAEAYYRTRFRDYDRKTFSIEPTSFLEPLAGRLHPGATVLDVGCGSGRDLLWFQKRGFTVVGLERSAGLADMARSRVGCRVIVGDFEQFEFSVLTFDALLMVGALVHLPHPRMPAALQSIASAARKNGHLLVTLKRGVGRRVDSEGRIFYLWENSRLREVFRNGRLQVERFFEQPSIAGTGDIWLGYVLRKM